MFRRKPDLPEDRVPAWRSFLDCAEVIEGGRRVLLGTLPTGRVEPAPIAAGVDAQRRAIADAREWMDAWRVAEVEHEWQDCARALDEVLEVAASTNELEELLESLQGVIDPLDSFADAERAWRRQWRLPRG